MSVSLVKINEALKAFTEQHLQVNEYSLSDPLELMNGPETRFPVMIALFKPSNVQGKNVFVNMDILFMDLVNKDLSNELDVSNDQFQIALDLRAFLDGPDYNDLFVVGENLSLIPFWEKGTNEVTGWTLGLQLKCTDLKDRCQIPLT